MTSPSHPVPAIQDTETPTRRDARMAWWREARFGLFIHWGLYAIPAGTWNGKPVAGYGEWIMYDARIPVADYRPLAARFDPASFDAEAWVGLAKAAGMKYIVVTAKHHDGFALFRSEADPFNAVDGAPFRRDPLRELADACARQGMRLGFYYSQDQDWTFPGGSSAHGYWDPAQEGDFAAYLEKKALPQLRELLTNYGPYPDVLWFDTPTAKMTPELAGKVVSVLNTRPGLIWNNRLEGGYAGDTETPEQHIPPRGYPGKDWEACMTLNGTWGYKSDDAAYKPTALLLRNLIDIASKGGNYLLNVGPDADGTIPAPQAERLREIGRWLEANGEAVYGTEATPFPRHPSWGRVTRKGERLYLHVFDWPADGMLRVPLNNPAPRAFLLAAPEQALPLSASADGIAITLPPMAPDPVASVVVLEIEGAADALPFPPVPPVAQDADGTIRLKVAEADLLSADGTPPEARLQGEVGNENIGYWTRERDYVLWKVKVERPGLFAVTLAYSAAPAWDGNGFVLAAGAETLHGTLPTTGDYNVYREIAAGTIRVAAGVLEVSLRPEEVRGSFGNLRAVVLAPRH